MQTFQIKITGICFLCRHQSCTTLIQIFALQVYKSASKRKAHILKNHPGAELPPSIRKLRPAGPGEPDPMLSTHTQLTGTIATPPVCCPHCSKQYSSKVWGVPASDSLSLGMLFHHGLCLLSVHKQHPLFFSVGVLVLSVCWQCRHSLVVLGPKDSMNREFVLKSYQSMSMNGRASKLLSDSDRGDEQGNKTQKRWRLEKVIKHLAILG